MTWINKYSDILNEQDREYFIEEEMANDQNATGIVQDRANAERVFNQMHTEVNHESYAN